MPKEVQRQNNFNIYLYKLLKIVLPDYTITAEALNETNMLAHSLAEKIVASAVKLAHSSDKKTITDVEMRSALTLVMGPTPLQNNAQQFVRDTFAIDTSYEGVSGPRSRTKTRGLQISVSRCENVIRYYSRMRVSPKAALVLAAALENIFADLLDLAGGVCRTQKRVRLTSRCIALAVENDTDLVHLFNGVSKLSGGKTKYATKHGKFIFY
jgi:histone H3/H4